MSKSSLSLPVITSALLALASCNEAERPAEDPEDQVFLVADDDKADAAGIQEGSWDAIAVLKLVNSATHGTLYDQVGLSRFPTDSILNFRSGPDRKLGTTDDRAFSSLAQLDAQPWVGLITFSLLRSYAERYGYGPKLAEEYVFPGEEAATQQVIESIYRRFNTQARPVHRDAHAKAHGCVKGFFRVDNQSLPQDLRVGYLTKNQEYPAWIRFSNGDFEIKADKNLDGRGMAIKLMGVQGTKILPDESSELTQDFVMINHQTFFVRNPIDYVELSNKVADGSPLTYFLKLNPLMTRFRELSVALALTARKTADPLSARYFSMTPYLLGKSAIKFSARPCTDEKPSIPLLPGDNYLRETLTIPKQSFESADQISFCEHLSFTPWHSLPEHRPLGGINRARKTVYSTISKLRHNLNQVPRKEPTSH